jgi:rod shape determining protein RodA
VIDRRLLTNVDWVLLTLVLAIAGIGIANIHSAVIPYKIMGTSYEIKQLYWMTAGFMVAMVVCSIDYHVLEDVSYWFYGTVVLLLVLVLLVGRTSMGATRWLHLGFFNIQPSEPMKLVIIITFASFFSRRSYADGIGLADLGGPLILLGLPALLVMKQPDLGTAIMIILVAVSIMFYVGVRLQTVLTVVGAVIPLLYLGWNYGLREYQKNRVLNFIDPERDPLGSGYHLIQSKIAVGSGGIIGKGYTHGTQTQLRFLPEQHTDFAFSVFAEEWGFAGCLVLLLLYMFLIMWGLQIANRCNDRLGSILAVGVTAMLFWHVVINIGMVIGLFPVVGVPLPFFSYGGTSMVTSMIGIGILLNIRMRRFMF